MTRDTLIDVITHPTEFSSLQEALSSYETFRVTPNPPIFETEFYPCKGTDGTVQFWFKINDLLDLKIWAYAGPEVELEPKP